MISQLQRFPKSQGFSLIELMVVVALIAILGALAAPSFSDYGVRSNLRSIGNDFSASILKSRNEAIGKNTCVTMCMSSTVDTPISGGTAGPRCTTTGDDWQVGWIAFLNESCNTGWLYPHTSPTDNAYDGTNLLIAKRAVEGEYYLNSQTSGRRRFNFNAQGNPGLGGASEFDLVYRAANDPKTLKYAFNICVDKIGRTRSVPSGSACASY